MGAAEVSAWILITQWFSDQMENHHINFIWTSGHCDFIGLVASRWRDCCLFLSPWLRILYQRSCPDRKTLVSLKFKKKKKECKAISWSRMSLSPNMFCQIYWFPEQTTDHGNMPLSLSLVVLSCFFCLPIQGCPQNFARWTLSQNTQVLGTASISKKRKCHSNLFKPHFTVNLGSE